MNASSPRVSVVIPAYNASRYIKQTIESVLTQTFRDFEIIVVDDGSTDDTPGIVQQFGVMLRYIRQSNQGLSAARNTAIKNAQSDFIALLDSDDLWEPEFLERMIYLLNCHPEAAGVYCGFQYINSKGEIVGKPSLKIVPPELFNVTMTDEGSWLAPCAVIFRKQLAEEVGLFDESLQAVEDWDMWIRMSNRQPFIGLPEALVKYRRHENNMSQNPERMIKAICQLTERRFGTAEGDASTWSLSKKKAYGDLYLNSTIRYFAAGNVTKSAESLQKLVEMSLEDACSLTVWRSIVRSHTPIEYQFDPYPPHDWELMHARLAELLSELAQSSDRSSETYGSYPRMKGFAFLALADEAGRAGELSRAFKWLWKAMNSHLPLLFERPYWGTLLRSVTTFRHWRSNPNGANS